MTGFALVWDTQNIIAKKKYFAWKTSREAILLPALAQSRANSDVRSACWSPCLIELWISPRWPAPVLSHSSGKFFSLLRPVEVSHVSACVSCTLSFHSTTSQNRLCLLKPPLVSGVRGGEGIPPLPCSDIRLDKPNGALSIFSYDMGSSPPNILVAYLQFVGFLS